MNPNHYNSDPGVIHHSPAVPSLNRVLPGPPLGGLLAAPVIATAVGLLIQTWLALSLSLIPYCVLSFSTLVGGSLAAPSHIAFSDLILHYHSLFFKFSNLILFSTLILYSHWWFIGCTILCRVL